MQGARRTRGGLSYLLDYTLGTWGASGPRITNPGASVIIEAADETGQQAAGVWDARLNTGTWTVDVTPTWASGDPPPGTFRYLYQLGSAAVFYFYQNGSTMQIRIDRVGANILARAITFGAAQRMALTVDWPSSQVTISGATTGDGTYALAGGPTDWGEDPGVDTLFIGASSTNARVLLGTLSRPVGAP